MILHGALKVILLILSIVPKGEGLNGRPETQEMALKLPPGYTLEDCEKNKQPVINANAGDAQLLSAKCVELDLVPASKA